MTALVIGGLAVAVAIGAAAPSIYLLMDYLQGNSRR